MRIIAGRFKGKSIDAPKGLGTRPTSDRVRESIFNMLFSLQATEGSAVLDLYAGCGALGIEALSRGAASCVFVEQHRRAVSCIETNLELTGFADRGTVVQADAVTWVGANDAPLKKSSRKNSGEGFFICVPANTQPDVTTIAGQQNKWSWCRLSFWMIQNNPRRVKKWMPAIPLRYWKWN